MRISIPSLDAALLIVKAPKCAVPERDGAFSHQQWPVASMNQPKRVRTRRL